jgi:glycosyltransferase involved in cell wall biosynthesis
MNCDRFEKFQWMWRDTEHTRPRSGPHGRQWPKLTIITPSFNQGRFIEETIRSVLYQGYPNLEYVVIDGGSTDRSIEVINKYVDRLAYWVSEKDRGQANAVNKGLNVATGDIIGWINSDDVYAPNTFRSVATKFMRSNELGLVYGSRILLDENSRVTGWVPSKVFNPELTGYNVCSETAFWRRAPDDPRLNENLSFAIDLDLFLRLIRNRRSLCLAQYLGCFRCYDENKSSTMPDVCRRETAACWEAEYGIGHRGWCEQPSIGWLQMALSLALNPQLIAAPYFYNRLSRLKRY